MKLVATIIGVSALLLAGVTYTALEIDGVLIAETQAPGAAKVRLTHIWYVQANNMLILDAGNRDNPWVRDLANGGTLHLRDDGLDGEYAYFISQSLDHKSIRELMRAKYGWRDWWISKVFDTSGSFPIEVVRADT